MYEWWKGVVERLLMVPPAPSAPPGDEGTTRVFRASPRYYLYRLIGWVLTRIVTLIAALMAAASTYVALGAADSLRGAVMVMELVVLAGFFVQGLFSYVALRLDYEKRWYLVTDRSLRIREGVLHVREMTITFANIQNISISQGPVQRLFGISDVRVDTAGGAGSHANSQQPGLNLHTAFFRGVDDPNRIRSLMQERLRQLRDAGLGDFDDPTSRLALPGEAARSAAPSDAALSVLRQVRAEARALRTLFL